MLLTGLGVVAIAALLRCPSGPGSFGSCFAGATAILDGTMKAAATEGDESPLAPELAIKPAAAVPAQMPAGRTQTAWSEALIAGTFDQLPAEPGRVSATQVPESGADDLTTGSIPARPVIAAGQEAPASSPGNEDAVSPDAVAALPMPRIDDARREAAAKAVTATASASETWTVGGRGVNVRSGPSKSSGKLFALAPGEEVRITQRKRGWLHVVDEQGRTGWAYSSFLVKPRT